MYQREGGRRGDKEDENREGGDILLDPSFIITDLVIVILNPKAV